MSTCDVIGKNSTSGQLRIMSSTRCKDERVHLAHVAIHHLHSTSVAHSYAAPTIASQLRMKLGGLPCQRYKPVEEFLPLCYKRDTSKTTAKPLHSKDLNKRMSSENNFSKSSDATVRIHPTNKTSSTGDRRLVKWHHQGLHRPLQNNGLGNKRDDYQQFSSNVTNSQLKDLNCDKRRIRQNVPQIANANISRKISATKGSAKKAKEVLRGITPKSSQTKRTVDTKTQSLELSKTCHVKKDPLFEQMVEEEQRRWLAEVKNMEDKRKEFYCIHENLHINFKVEWISYNIDSDLIPTDASISTSQDLQKREKDFTENLATGVIAEKSKDTMVKKMNEELILIESSGVVQETSIVEGVIVDAYTSSNEETTVADPDMLSHQKMFASGADIDGGNIVEETSLEEAGTANLNVDSQQEGHTDENDGKSTEEILLPVTELDKNCFNGESYTATKPSCLDGNCGNRNLRGQKSSLSANLSQSHDRSSSEFETGNGKSVTRLSSARSGSEGSDVKYEIENLPEEAVITVCTGNKELLLEKSSVETKTENDGINNMARELSLSKVKTTDLKAETFSSSMASEYKVSDATEKDNVTEICLQLSGVDAKVFEGRSDNAVMQVDTGMGDIDGGSNKEMLEKQQVNNDAIGKVRFERKENEMNYVVELHSVMNERNLDSEIGQNHKVSESGITELPVHLKGMPVQSVSGNNLTSASLNKIEAEGDHLSLNDADLQMSFHKKSNATGSQGNTGLHEVESEVCGSLDGDGRDLTYGFDKYLKQNNLSRNNNQRNVKKQRAAYCDIPNDCTNDLEDISMDDSGFNATVAVRGGTSAHHSTTVDVVCLGSDHASVTPCIALIGDSISA